MSFDRMMTYPKSRSAWSALAYTLSDGSWHSLENLRKALRDHEADLSDSAVSGILMDAYRAGFLEKRWGAKKRRYYRVTPAGRMARPELRSGVLISSQVEAAAETEVLK